MTCLEHDFSKIARMEAFPLTGEGSIGLPIPIYVIANVLRMTSYPESKSAIEDGGMRISFNRDTAKCTEKVSRSVSGLTHQIVISWDTQSVTEDDVNRLLTLQRNPHEIVITYFGMQQKVIRTDADGYAFEFYEDNGITKCSMTLTNGQGLTTLL